MVFRDVIEKQLPKRLSKFLGLSLQRSLLYPLRGGGTLPSFRRSLDLADLADDLHQVYSIHLSMLLIPLDSLLDSLPVPLIKYLAIPLSSLSSPSLPFLSNLFCLPCFSFRSRPLLLQTDSFPVQVQVFKQLLMISLHTVGLGCLNGVFVALGMLASDTCRVGICLVEGVKFIAYAALVM